MQSILDAIPSQLAVIDRSGRIVYVNEAWRRFGGRSTTEDTMWTQTNYLEVCDLAASLGEHHAAGAARAIRAVMRGLKELGRTQYPCGDRWFEMTVRPILPLADELFIVCHTDITDSRRATEAAQALSTTDVLTGLGNRRGFDQALQREWLRCQRHRHTLSMILMDIDRFKAINDLYGHPVGDATLQKVGEVLLSFARRSGDLVARVGGDEFAVLLPSTDTDGALHVAEDVYAAMTQIAVPVPGRPSLSVSMGVAALIPERKRPMADLFLAADQSLYRAKEAGRGRIMA